jgi:hypothetical protein
MGENLLQKRWWNEIINYRKYTYIVSLDSRVEEKAEFSLTGTHIFHLSCLTPGHNSTGVRKMLYSGREGARVERVGCKGMLAIASQIRL